MSVGAAFAVRVVIAACGIALIAMAAGLLRRSADLPQQRSPAAWETLLVRIALFVAPTARRSELLRRPSAATADQKRVALTGPTCWVSRAVRAIERANPIHRQNIGITAAERVSAAMAALRAACALCAVAAVLPLSWVAGGFIGAIALLVALSAAWLPDIALVSHARRCQRRVDTAMPAALELLAACCRGGIALESALALTAAHAPQPLRGVLDRARRRQRAGESPTSALRVEAEAIGVHEVGAIGRLVERHHQLGLPLEGPLLARAQAARARARIAALARIGRGVPVASLLVATVIAPCSVGVLATWVILATLGEAGFA